MLDQKVLMDANPCQCEGSMVLYVCVIERIAENLVQYNMSSYPYTGDSWALVSCQVTNCPAFEFIALEELNIVYKN